MGLSLLATGSLRIAFLLPSMLAGLACLALLYDLGRRLWNRETGLAAALALLFTVQFVWQTRQAQIDATLLFWCVLSLYGLLRHLLRAGLGMVRTGLGRGRLRRDHQGRWFPAATDIDSFRLAARSTLVAAYCHH